MEIPSFLQKVLYYIIFVVALEFIMRIFATIKQLFTSPSDTSPSDIETAESETKE